MIPSKWQGDAMLAMSNSLSLGLGALAFVAGHAVAQLPSYWTQAAGNSPSALQNHAMAYDAARSRMVLFGTTESSTETWERVGTSWGIRTNGNPGRRGAMAMTYDATSGAALLLGGKDSYYTYSLYGDAYNWNGNGWVTMPSGPCRYYHAMAHDTQRAKTVVFGGYGIGSGPAGGCATYNCGILGDTWEKSGNAWTLASSTGPSPRLDHRMCYDSIRGRMVLFGGWTTTSFYVWTPQFDFSSSIYGDTWEWDGANWTQVATSGPSPRFGHAMAFDSIRGRTVLYGGYNRLGVQGDTWEWDGVNWYQITTGGPAARSGHSMAFDPQRGCVVLFGGRQGSGSALGDTWEYAGSTVASFQSLGQGCSGSAGMPVLSNSAGSLPRFGSSLNLEIGNLQPVATVCVGFFGFNNQTIGTQTLPASLSAYGMPGCTIYTDIYGSYFLLSTTGTANWSIPIPPVAGLGGTYFHPQALIFDPLAGNAANAIMSNAANARIGI